MAAPIQLARPRISRTAPRIRAARAERPHDHDRDDVEQGQLHAAHRASRRVAARARRRRAAATRSVKPAQLVLAQAAAPTPCRSAA